MGNSQTWKVHLVFVGGPDPWLTRAAYGSNRIPQGTKTQASASAFFMMLNSEKRHLTEVLDAPPSDIWALHQPRIWPRTTFPPSAIGKRKQHPTGVGYSPSASKDFSTLQRKTTCLDISQLLKPLGLSCFGQHGLWLLYLQCDLFAVCSLRLFFFSIPQRQVV